MTSGDIVFWSLGTGDLITEYGCAMKVEEFSFSNGGVRIEGTCDSGYSFVLDTSSGKAEAKVVIDATESTAPLYPTGERLIRDMKR